MVNKTAFITSVAMRYEAILECLSEKGRRLWASAEALSYGRGGISLVCQATGLARSTIHRGIKEIQNPSASTALRIRKQGGGRKRQLNAKNIWRKPWKV